MIWNKLSESERLNKLYPGFTEAFEFLRSKDSLLLPVGTYEIDGKNVFAMVQKGTGKGLSGARLESHRRYIDIQYTVSGEEYIGCAMASACHPDAEGWNLEKDLIFFEEKPDFALPVPAGHFAIFFPEEDAHAPWIGSGDIHKIVVKVAI